MSSAKVKSIGPVEKRAVNVEDLSDELFGRTTRSSKAAASVKVVLPKNQKEEKETQTEEPMQVASCMGSSVISSSVSSSVLV